MDMIEIVDTRNFEKLLPLIAAYQEFYRVPDISVARNREFFARFMGGTEEGAQFLQCEGADAAGFATVYFTYSSTATARVAVLNDLYVKPSYRKQGRARELIHHCLEYGKSKGAVRLQWLTQRGNRDARTAYDRIGANRSEWVFYTYPP